MPAAAKLEYPSNYSPAQWKRSKLLEEKLGTLNIEISGGSHR
jgi:hypothetical protein